MKAKTLDALIEHLMEKHHIEIENSQDKLNLRNIGYYHGYKGYRYIKQPKNRIDINNFSEIVSIVNFDSRLKSLLYPQIMQIETISKNIVLQLLVEEYDSDDFDVIYEKGMTDYRSSGNEKDYKNKLKHRFKVRNDIYDALARAYSKNNKIVSHFYSRSRDKRVPIWGIFEIITLGTFADLIKSLEFKVRNKIDKEMNLNTAYDANGRFPEKIMYLIKELRNPVAHNDVVFDVRFKNSDIDKTLCKYLGREIGCENIDFKTITDYVLIISLLLKKYGVTKTEINRFINEFERIIEDFRNEIQITNMTIYNQIIYDDIETKLSSLREFIKAR